MLRREVSVVIVSYETATELRECLASLATAAAAAAVTCQTIVVDNHSADGSVEVARAAEPDAVIVQNQENRGFAAAANQGLALATAGTILLLNPDTVVNAEALEACLAALEDPGVGIAAPILLNSEGTVQQSWHEFPTRWRALIDTVPPVAAARILGRRALGPPREPDWVIGAFLMTRRDVLDRIGMVSEATFMYGEDMELCLRARRNGYRIRLLPAARAVHLGGAAARKQFKGTERDHMVEQAALLAMQGSLVYAIGRWLSATEQGAALRILRRFAGHRASRFDRALARREAARAFYWRAIRTGRLGKGAAAQPGHRGLRR